jgi:hypothetical protein
MSNPMGLIQFGRLPQKIDGRTLELSRYVPPKPIAVPPSTFWTDPTRAKNLFHVNLKWSPKLNNKLSCCVESSYADMVQLQTLNENRYHDPSDADVMEFYAGVLGVDPASIVAPGPGTYMLDAMNYLRRVGFGPTKEKITGYASVNMLPWNDAVIRQAIYQFGGVLFGFNCPQSAVDAYHAGDGHPWVWVPNSPVIGGHCILLTGYDQNRYYGVSWGALKAIESAFLRNWGVEAYTVLTAGWKVLGGFDLPAFKADQAIAIRKTA